MKTTIEINDELLREAKARAKRNGTTLREQVEEGLRLLLKQQSESQASPKVKVLVFQGEPGLTAEFADADWAKIKELARER